MDFTPKKLLGLISELSKVSGYQDRLQKPVIFYKLETRVVGIEFKIK
jgi:hypothetical protein